MGLNSKTRRANNGLSPSCVKVIKPSRRNGKNERVHDSRSGICQNISDGSSNEPDVFLAGGSKDEKNIIEKQG